MRMLAAMAAAWGVPAAAQLAYVEQSTGLTGLGWDGGRTVLQLADLNGDGRLDLVTIGDHGSPFINTQMHGFTIWFGTAGGGWQLFQTGNFGYGGVSVGDVNNDGIPDLAYGMHHNYSGTALGNQVLEAALNDGTGMAWTPWDQNLGMQGQTWGMFGTALADTDADGWLDLMSVSFGCCDGVHAYRNNRDGTWTPTLTQLGGNSTMDVTSGDVNNDGYPDFATAHQSGTVRRNTGAGGFTLDDAGLPSGGTLGRRGPDLADVNGDGRDDLSFVNPAGGVEVWLRQAGGGWTAASSGLPAAGSNSTSRLVDMDGDGMLDVVGFGGGTLTVWRGNGGAGWVAFGGFTVPSPGTYSGMAIADVDRNGRPDIALVSRRTTGLFSSINELRLFKETSASPGVSIGVQTPPVHRVVRAGSTTFVTWRSSLPAGMSATVDLEVSLSGASGPWLPLAMGVHDTGRRQVRLDPGWNTTSAHVRATLHATMGFAQHTHGPVTIAGTCCAADCNCDGQLNLADFGCFQTRFALGDPYADCNGDGQLNLADFGCFQTRFALGCP